MSDWNRFNDQFRETPDERNNRLRNARHRRTQEAHWKLIHDLSGFLCDEGMDLSNEGVDALRRRVANALPPVHCPDWLAPFRDPTVVAS